MLFQTKTELEEQLFRLRKFMAALEADYELNRDKDPTYAVLMEQTINTYDIVIRNVKKELKDLM